MLGLSDSTWDWVFAVAAVPGIVLFAALISWFGWYGEHKDQRRLDEFHLEQERLRMEIEKATVDCEELWAQWDWERERGLR